MCSQLIKGLLQIQSSSRQLLTEVTQYSFLCSDWVASLACTAWAVNSAIKPTTSCHSTETQC